MRQSLVSICHSHVKESEVAFLLPRCNEIYVFMTIRNFSTTVPGKLYLMCNL